MFQKTFETNLIENGDNKLTLSSATESKWRIFNVLVLNKAIWLYAEC